MTVILRNVRPWGEAASGVALEDGAITAVRPATEDAVIPAEAPPAVDVVEGRGRILLPSFSDAHVHLDSTRIGLPFPRYLFRSPILMQDMGVLAGRFRHGFCPQSPMIRGVLPPEPTWQPGKR